MIWRIGIALLVAVAAVVAVIQWTAIDASPEIAQAKGFDTSPLAIETADGRRHDFVVEVARTPSQRAQGLMYRKSVAENAGMLFDYGRSQEVAMWMKNTFVPLDMLFIDKSGRIVNLAERAVPHSVQAISSAGEVRGVLELRGGTVSRLGVRRGDRVIHPIFGTGP